MNRKVSLIFLLLAHFFTFGFYWPYWWVGRGREAYQSNSGKGMITHPFYALAALPIMMAVIIILEAFIPDIKANGAFKLILFFATYSVVANYFLVNQEICKAINNQNRPDSPCSRLITGLLLLLAPLDIVYLQYHINLATTNPRKNPHASHPENP